MPSLIATLGANIAPFTQDMERAKSEAGQHGHDIASQFGEELSSKLAGLASAAAIVEFAHQAMELGHAMEVLHARTGLGVEELQRLSLAAKLTGSSVDDLVVGIEKLSVAQAKAKGGDAKSYTALKTFGMNDAQIEDTTHLLQTFLDTGERIRGMDISGELEKAMKDVFGKGGAQFLAPFKLGLKGHVDDFQMEGQAVVAQENIEALAATHAFLVKWTSIAKADIMNFGTETGGLFVSVFKDVFTLGGSLTDHGSYTKDFFEREKQMYRRQSGGDLEPYKSDVDTPEERERKSREKTDKSRAQMNTARDAALDTEHNKATVAEIKAARAMAAKVEEREAEKAKREQEKREKFAEKEMIDLYEGPKHKAPPTEVNQLQRMGGFLGSYVHAPELVMLDVQKKSERHLDAIRKAMERMDLGIDDSSY
jgi:hypothetical protein